MKLKIREGFRWHISFPVTVLYQIIIASVVVRITAQADVYITELNEMMEN